MTRDTIDRRDVVKLMAAAGAAVPAARALWPDAAHAAAPAYDPAGKFELDVKEVEFRRNGAGRMLMARIYQPKGPGPFPTVLDLHGGAWNRTEMLLPTYRHLGLIASMTDEDRHDCVQDLRR